MATTYRRRHNLVSTTLGAALATGATSITFAAALKEGGTGGSNIATLGTDEYLPLTIDNEVVYLTAYTSGATSGTIVRAQEGTVDPGADHANGTAVKNAPTKRDTVRFRYTQYTPGADISTSSTSFVDIDGTNLPALPLTLAVGDIVELSLDLGVSHNTAGSVVKFDWLIDRPTSADTSIGALTSTQGAGHLDAATNQNNNLHRSRITAVFVCTEAGVHTFKPQWRVGGGSAAILGSGGNYQSPILHMVKNLGQQTGA